MHLAGDRGKHTLVEAGTNGSVHPWILQVLFAAIDLFVKADVVDGYIIGSYT
jgi:hypothetical protein